MMPAALGPWLAGERVEVYRCRPRGDWSIRLPGGQVIGHADEVDLDEVEFRVQPAGRERARAEKRRNVHAYVVGRVGAGAHAGRPVTYRPAVDDTFVWLDTGEPVHRAAAVTLHADGSATALV
ncbi:hypothetical protein I5G67_gp076 [Mycobacterium phage Aminay]|uniref:Uncharacterized protein n=1 Tax=Mycobacterium phage Aminay TaxID=2250291 RepID=A0A345KV60_9CAUD|nr:hypothetical protein I5G67_gp076 [Mycobacterium phage Aminay]AXH46912.1 hypothetical protein SEA_AMINAY_76 [Mycobacterium phage Aminay]